MGTLILIICTAVFFFFFLGWHSDLFADSRDWLYQRRAASDWGYHDDFGNQRIIRP